MAYKQKSPKAVIEGGTGATDFLLNGILVGADENPIDVIFPGTNGQILISGNSVAPQFTDLIFDENLTSVVGLHYLKVTLSDDFEKVSTSGWDGTFLTSPSISVTSNGSLITFNVSPVASYKIRFSTGIEIFDATNGSDHISLIGGLDTSPILAYVYIKRSTLKLGSSMSGWPTEEYAPVAMVLCQSPASVQTEGAYIIQSWMNDFERTNDQGHISHLNSWVRQQNATWISDIDPTLTITPNGTGPDGVKFTSTSGQCLQLHQHTFPAFTSSASYYVPNDATTAYRKINDFNSLLTDSTGGDMTNRYFSLVVWGVINDSSSDCKLMVNLPSGSYGTEDSLLADSKKFANYDIPSDFKGSGFLIAEFKMHHVPNFSGTWTLIKQTDLRGLFPSIVAGGGASFPVEFPDNTFRIFDDIDNKKKVAFEVSNISPGITRSVSLQNADGTMALTNVANYGTGATSFAAFGLVAGGISTTAGLQSVLPGSTDQVLAANGPTALPSFKTMTGGVKYTKHTTAGFFDHVLDPNCTALTLCMYSGGAGGGSGRVGSPGTASGGAGGNGGGFIYALFPVETFGGPGATVNYKVGAGGTGGAAVTTPNTNGNAGSLGEGTFFGGVGYHGFARAEVVWTSDAPGGTSSVTPPGLGTAMNNEISSYNEAFSKGGAGGLTNGNDADLLPIGVWYPAGGGGGAGSPASVPNIYTGGNGGFHRTTASFQIDVSGSGGNGTNSGIGGDGISNTGTIFIGGTGGGGGGTDGQTYAGHGGKGSAPGGGGGGGAGDTVTSGAGGDGGDGAIYIMEFLSPGV